MKMKKIPLFILSFTTFFSLISTKVNALVARVIYNPVNVFISNAMVIAPIILTIVYIIGAIIYYIKSKKDKKSKIIRLIIWLIVIAVLSAILYFCSDDVLRAGVSYSRGTKNFLKIN